MLKPMEPVLSTTVIETKEYLYQVKWDGIRIIAEVEGSSCRLYTRHGNERTKVYPEVTTALATDKSSLLLDGEMVVIHQGTSDFHQILKRDRAQKEEKIKALQSSNPAVYMIFDLLSYNGNELLTTPLSERLTLLDSLSFTAPSLQVCPSNDDGGHLFAATKELGWEGIVMKERDGLYYPGQKHPTWKKAKHFDNIEATVGGVLLRDGRAVSLLLGRRDEGKLLNYIGRVRSGLNQASLHVLTASLPSLSQSTSPFTSEPPIPSSHAVQWLHPVLTCSIQYLGWTPAQTLRHATLLGFY
ncbi:hypothetical protein [Mechercharimyces sp. CAU 1602]|uniref:ATP-dependent DNA ligase n=1 Tax=Mechercharimyces sp. CAU 1602 TaxID=2973933 RepID=UPI0021617259|nr:hypothetical protein [Mechercharimyces sp. CAU 1602]MCS1351021.1 hypothetical protein [Mechercharimyces sp. CAU 1602]